MRTLFALFFTALAGVLFCVAPSLVAQDKATKLKDGVFKVSGLLARDDPKDRVRTTSVHKVHTLNLVAGKTYTIDLESSDFDAYLRLEDSTGKQLAEDDDSGNGLNARIILRAQKDDTHRIIVTTFLGGQGNYTLTVKGAGLGAQKPPVEKATLAVLSKDFLPHKPGTILYYDDQMNLPDRSVVVSRWKHAQKDNGVVEKTLEKIGTLKAGESILQGATVTWLKEVNDPTKSIEHHRLQGGFIEIGIDHAGNGKIVWEPVLKMGAKTGEAWRWESPIGFKLYESWGIREANGRLSATIYATMDVGNTKIRKLVWYEEGKGVVKSSIATAKGDEKPIVTAESVLVQDTVEPKPKIAPVQDKPANAEEKGVLHRLAIKGVHSVVYSPDGRYLATSSDDGITVWDAKEAKEISKCVPEIKRNPETLYSTSKGGRLAFSKNGKYLYADITRSETSNLKQVFFGTLFVFESSNGKQVRSYDFHNIATPRGFVMFSPDGAELLVTSNPVNKKVEVFATETGTLVHQFDMIKIPGTNVADFLASISMSHDKKRLLIASNYGRMYSLEDGKELRVFQWPNKRVQQACFCPDGKRVLLTFGKSVGFKTEFTFVVFNTESEKEEQTLEGGGVDGSFWKFAVSPDGQMALSGDYSKTTILWSIASGKQLRTHKGFSSVAFSPKGDSYAVCAGNMLTIYEAPKLPPPPSIEEKKEQSAPKEASKQGKVPNETQPEKTLDKKEKVEQKAVTSAAKPKILDEKTWTWEGSTYNYAKCKDLTFEVSMGNKPDGVGCADAGVEIENVRNVKLSVDAPPSFNRYDENSFAGFMVDYHTSAGYTKRVGLSIGMYSEKRWAKTPIWGKVTVPSQFVDLGKKKEYDLDLQKWAPDGWDGRVWFVVSLQNTGRNTTLKAKAELLGEEERTKVVQKSKEEPAKPKDDKALLQGRWYAVAEEAVGKTLSKDELLTMNKILDVKGDEFHMERTDGGKRGSYVGTIRLGQADGQKLFDFEGKRPSGAQVELHGIYELTQDVFKVCYAVVPAGSKYTRPREFRTFAGTPTVFVTFKRSAEKDETALRSANEMRAKVVGEYHMLVPKGIIKVEFTKTNKFISDGKEAGSWSVKDGKVLIEFGSLGWSELSFKDKNTLAGVRRYASKTTIGHIPVRDVEYVREGTEAAAALASRAKREAVERENADKDRLEALAKQREAAKRLTADDLGKLGFTEIKERIGEPTEVIRSTRRRNLGLAIWNTGEGKSIVVSFIDGIDGRKTLVLTAHVNRSVADVERMIQVLNEPEPLPKDARRLTARVKTVSKDNLDQMFTQHLQKLSVSVTDKQIILDFDVDRKNWQPVTRGFSLVVRVFDKDGQYLTHFVTKESFTASPDVFDGWMMVVNRVKDDPPQVQAALLGGFTPKLLEANGNRLIYNVNPALLQNAAIAEIGFIHVPKKAPF